MRINQMPDSAKPGNNRLVDTRNKRTKEQREADLALISRLLMRENLTQQEIADKVSAERNYSLSISTIGIDVKELLNRWKTEYL